MTRPFARRWLFRALRCVPGAVFAYAGVVKLAGPQALADSVASFRLLPGIAINPLALALPPFEIAVGVWLLSGWRRREAAFCAAAATGVFLLALLSALARGLPVECGCFGAVQSAWTPNARLWWDAGRDAVLLGICLSLYFDAWREPPATRPPDHASSPL